MDTMIENDELVVMRLFVAVAEHYEREGRLDYLESAKALTLDRLAEIRREREARESSLEDNEHDD